MVHLLRHIRDNNTLGLNYYADTNDTPVSDLLRQASIKTDNKLMAFSDSTWKYFPDTGRITVTYIIFYQGGPIDHGTHVPGPFSQSSTESDYNVAHNSGMALANLRMLIHGFLNKDPDIVLEEYTLIILESKSTVFMDENGKDTNHTRDILKRSTFCKEW